VVDHTSLMPISSQPQKITHHRGMDVSVMMAHVRKQSPIRNYVNVDVPLTFIGEDEQSTIIVGGFNIYGNDKYFKNEAVTFKNLTVCHSMAKGFCSDIAGQFKMGLHRQNKLPLTMKIDSCTIMENSSAGIACYGSNCFIYNSKVINNGGNTGQGGIVSGMDACVKVFGEKTVVQGNLGRNLDASPAAPSPHNQGGTIALMCPLTEEMVYTNECSMKITGEIDTNLYLCTSFLSLERDIILTGLKSEKYNGLKATQGKWVASKQRFRVKLKDNGQEMLIRPCNIVQDC
jgi:hypothetical protein